MIKERRYDENGMRFDVYRDGVNYKHTGYEVRFDDDPIERWWGEYEDQEGNIEYFN